MTRVVRLHHSPPQRPLERVCRKHLASAEEDRGTLSFCGGKTSSSVVRNPLAAWREKHSFPIGESKNALGRLHPLAQSVEHLTFNQGVPSSNLGGVTKGFRFPTVAGGWNVENQGTGFLYRGRPFAQSIASQF